MPESTSAQLDRLQALIARIEANGTASYSDGGQSYSYQNLPALYDREEVLLRRLAAEQGGNFRFARPVRRA